MAKRLVWIVFDSVGVGSLPDAARFGDEGANTLLSASRAVPGFACPNLASLGLGRLGSFPGIPAQANPIGSFGKCAERAFGKDTLTGHWEMAGVEVTDPFLTYTETGFPEEMMARFTEETGHEWMGNFSASGTEIINEYGDEHLRTKKLIIYTSADSVFQIAAHEEVIPIDELYRICRITRSICDDYSVARVIARPFVGRHDGVFQRTYNRRDYAVSPPQDSVLDLITRVGVEVHAIGKIADIFNGRGIGSRVKTKGNRDGLTKTREALEDHKKRLIYTNLVDFDCEFGHRRDAPGYGEALMEADRFLPQIISALEGDDLLLITADHGNDPNWVGTDHTREYIPLLAFSPAPDFKPGVDLGIRTTFADQGRTVSAYFGSAPTRLGTSFLGSIFN